MPPKKPTTPNDTTATTSSGGGGPGLNGKTVTESELKFVNAVLSNFIAKPDVDWAAVAAALALKDVKCTKERWRQIKNKFGWKEENNNNNDDGGGTGGVVGSSPSPAKVTKRTPKRTPRGRKVVTPVVGGASKAGGAAKEGGAGLEKEGDADAGAEVGVGLVGESPTPRQRKKLPNHRPRKEIIKPEPEDTDEEIGHQDKGDAGVV
ncbi:hypothetical protein QBC33DRAFT_553955 [Phialemonium atrogriseum]|uniref:Myb-like domain-containing protein n=1 Tax=Phialemonium atrogriseum TaxID=1093897 RepID=A0AAJ0C987_9PEZI|nr:uncharacterized protein QBC33DRAFT_553955 [Phialemonium atrogriseum]KAK1772505.1 hypothetical protein QBC33DRAFT_553955 [Phialemonium atrogriseum]